MSRAALLLAGAAIWTAAHAAPAEPQPQPTPVVNTLAPPVAPGLREGRPPRYPLAALQNGIDGSVEVEVTVVAPGLVKGIQLLSEIPAGKGFFIAVAVALQSWRFDPAEAGQRRLVFRFDHLTAPKPADPPADAADLPDAPKPLTRLRPMHPSQASSLDGEVSLAITIGPDLKVAQVAVISEAPTGYGFADRAIDEAQDMEFASDATPGIYRLDVEFHHDR